MFGKWPTRIFVSPKEEAAAANHSEIDNKSLEIFISRSLILLMDQRDNQAPKDTQLNLTQWSGDQDPAVRVITIQIFRKLLVNDDMAVIARGGRVHEMQNAITCTQREADVRSGIESASVAGNDSNDVAAA